MSVYPRLLFYILPIITLSKAKLDTYLKSLESSFSKFNVFVILYKDFFIHQGYSGVV